MSGTLLGLRKRVMRVERILTEFAERQKRVNCNCRNWREFTFADPDKPEEFEAEMNRICPVHRFRRLGSIVEIKHIWEGAAKSAKLEQLLKIYRARLSPHIP
jgi:hypothetical protein